jgi:uncharacterized protein YecE (DUF72 family)
MGMSRLHLGTIGWSYNFWKPMFYPKKTASKDYLAYYSSRFGTVEVDSTFYRIPTAEAVTNWKKQTPEGFLFSLKFPQMITHIKMLKDTQRETDSFLERMKLLEEKLGVLLLQFPPNFQAKRFPDLEAYLAKLPKEFRYVVEVRHESWLKEEFYALLRSYGVALAWAETPVMHSINQQTGLFLYMRWEGDRAKINGTLGKIEADKKADLQQWVEKLKPYMDKGIEVFGYFAKYYSGYPPSDIEYLQGILEPKAVKATLF